MTVKPPRRYSSPQRAEQANATRRQILTFAEALLGQHGFAAVTMDSIAHAAGVSIATVYLYFKTKPSIVAALAEQITSAGDLSVELVEHEVAPMRQLRTGARIMRQLNERSWVVADVLRSARDTDQQLAATWELWQQRHLAAMTRAVDALHAQDALRPGLTVAEAIDILYALTGTDVYRSLVRERGWTPDAYERWLFRTACTELLGTAPGDADTAALSS